MVETHPAGISSNQIIHFAQEYNSNEFHQFDHGQKKNIRKYGQAEPPRYELEHITSNMYIYYGLGDTSADFRDVARLEHLLPNIKMMYEVPLGNWGHLDFLFSTEVKKFINDPVIDVCRMYEQTGGNV